MLLINLLKAIFLLTSPIEGNAREIEQTGVRVEVYPYGGYYSYPPNCPPNYYYGPYARFYGPQCYYYGPYYGRRYYPYYWGPRQRYYYKGKKKYHGHQKGKKGHH